MYSEGAQLDTALNIFTKLYAKQEVSKEATYDLYEQYQRDMEVETLLNKIASGFGMEIYSYNDKLFLTAGIGNKLFGYTNDELKDRIPWIKDIDDLHLVMFIEAVILTMFYKESAMDTYVKYLSINEISDKVYEKCEALVNTENLEDISKQLSYDFASIAKKYKKMNPFDMDASTMEVSNQGIRNRRTMVITVCRAWQNDDLVAVDMNRDVILPTDRFKAIVYYFYENKANKNKIFDFINSL